MARDDDEDQRVRSPALVQLTKEDLERLSREELELRLTLLDAEKLRTQTALAARSTVQGVAESLFKR